MTHACTTLTLTLNASNSLTIVRIVLHLLTGLPRRFHLSLLLLPLATANTVSSAQDRAVFEGENLPAHAIFRVNSLRLRHANTVTNLCFSRDGTKLASASLDGTAAIFSVLDGKQMLRIQPDGAPVRSVAFSPDSARLAIGSDTAWIWDAINGKRLFQLDNSPATTGDCIVSYSNNGTLLAVASQSDSGISICRAADGQQVARLNSDASEVHALCFRQDDKAVIFGGRDRTIRVWDLAAGNISHSLIGHLAEIWALCLSPSGNVLASIDRAMVVDSGGVTMHKPQIYLWDIGKYTLLERLSCHSERITGLAFNPRGNVLASSSLDGTIHLWDLDLRKTVKILRVDSRGLDAIAVSACNRFVAAAGWDRAIGIWTLPDLNLKSVGSVSPLTFTDLCVRQEDRLIMLGDNGGTISQCRIGDNHLDRVKIEGRGLRIGDEGGSVLVEEQSGLGRMNLSKNCTIDKLYGDFGIVSGASASEKTGIIAVVEGGSRIKICDTRKGTIVSHDRERQSRHYISDVSLSSDGGTLVIGRATNSRVRRGGSVDIISLDHLHDDIPIDVSDANVRCVAVSANGQLVAYTCGTDTVWLYDVKNRRMRSLKSNGWGTGPVKFSRDGKRLVAAGDDECIRCWEVATGGEFAKFKGHLGSIRCLGFSPSGRRLASGGDDGTVLVWGFETLGKALTLSGEVGHAKDLEDMWARLKDWNAYVGQSAVWTLVANGELAIEFLASRLLPVQPISDGEIDVLVRNLTSSSSRVRDQAERELTRHAGRAGDRLKDMLKRQPPPETTRRLERILGGAELAGSTEGLRLLRALAVVEIVGTLKSRQILERVASGDPSEAITREARLSLSRLKGLVN